MRSRPLVKTAFLAVGLALLAPAGAHAWTLSGTVVWRGRALEGVACRVTLADGSVAPCVTDSLGRFSFPGLSGESAAFAAEKEGFFPARRRLFNFTGADFPLAVSLKKRIRWRLTGTVTDRGGRPVEGARVTFLETDGPRGASPHGGGDAEGDRPAPTPRSRRDAPQPIGAVTTDQAGRFVFADLWDTACAFRVEAEGYRRHTTWMRNVEQADREVVVRLYEASRDPGRKRLFERLEGIVEAGTGGAGL